jgi:hypothetical protein
MSTTIQAQSNVAAKMSAAKQQAYWAKFAKTLLGSPVFDAGCSATGQAWFKFKGRADAVAAVAAINTTLPGATACLQGEYAARVRRVIYDRLAARDGVAAADAWAKVSGYTPR